MSWLLRFFRSSVGSKVAMAITGVLLFGFLLGHLAGNLLVFSGPEAFNNYAQSLRDTGPLLWVARIGLIVLVTTHIGVAISLTTANRAARPIPYTFDHTVQASTASRSMMLTGITISAFVLFHLSHFTWGWIQNGYSHDTYVLADGREVHDVYAFVVRGFGNPMVAFTYLLFLAALLVHLRHGLSSFFQTLGLNSPRFDGFVRSFGPLVSAAIVLAYATIPVSALVGILSIEETTP